ncbi:HI0074 family nucleotidyltransferase substrate-binding subunit [Terriglobus sp. RCC_193]|uniref:HI0074 family nucleotidyltransferase substrate-binding subunit n=1 Tax=Terriglobus sp. RCC_193 TaxID=3239218 RepID=UPI003525EA36
MIDLDAPLRPTDLELYERILTRLREALDAHVREPENLFILDSVIKRFELTFELSNRNLNRFLLDAMPVPPEIRTMSYQSIIRLGDEMGMLKSGWPHWKRYRNARNRTVHEYYEESAREVAKDAAAFVEEAAYLLEQLKTRVIGNG